MILPLLRLTLVALSLAASARAAELAILAKARAHLGPEAALSSIASIRYTGTLTSSSPSEPAKQTRAAIEITFQKPYQQRIHATSDSSVEITALDGYDGWTRVQDVKDPSKWRQTLLGVDEIKRLRANTWENLSFFRGLEALGGRIEAQGTRTIDGATCQKIAFVHAPNIVFTRYFDVATGRLVLTETETGGTIREQGEMVVNGIRFPRTLITVSKNAKGEDQTLTINFDQITVNEKFPPATFAVPSLVEPKR